MLIAISKVIFKQMKIKMGRHLFILNQTNKQKTIYQVENFYKNARYEAVSFRKQQIFKLNNLN